MEEGKSRSRQVHGRDSVSSLLVGIVGHMDKCSTMSALTISACISCSLVRDKSPPDSAVLKAYEYFLLHPVSGGQESGAAELCGCDSWSLLRLRSSWWPAI